MTAEPRGLQAALAEGLRGLPEAAERLRGLPWPVAALLAAAGVAVLLAGARRRRPLAIAGGALVGWAAGAAASAWLQSEVGVPPLASCAAVAAALAVLSGLVPPLFLFAAGALPGALAGAALGGGEAFGVWTGVAVGGIAGLLLARLVAAAVAGGVGAVLLAAALLAASGSSGALRALADRPMALLAAAAVLAVAGAAFQYRRAWSPAPPRREAAPPDEGAETVAEPRP